MNKVKEIFIKLFVDSNRYKHFGAGLIIYSMMIVIQYLLMIMINHYDFGLSWFIPISTTSLVTVFLAMCSVEYIQKQSGGLFDWYDIFAGCFVPAISTIIISVLYIV